MVHVTRMIDDEAGKAKAKTQKKRGRKQQAVLSGLSEIAYEMLDILLLPMHGSPVVTFGIIVKVLSDMLGEIHN